MSWLWAMILFSFTVGNIVCESKYRKKLPSVVVGTVYCDTCNQKEFSGSSRFVSGASVVVECQDNASSLSFRKEVKTNQHGQFQVRLPFLFNKNVKKINLCSAQLIRSKIRLCNVAGVTTSSPFKLKSREHGSHIFSAGFLTFTPSKRPDACEKNGNTLINSKESITNFNETTIFPPPILGPQPDLPIIGHLLPPLPQLPLLPPLPSLPPLPELPRLPPLPTFPFPFQPTPAFPGVPLPPAGTPPASKTDSP